METSIDLVDSAPRKPRVAPLYVPESRFGVWFLGTETWAHHVLRCALENLENLIENRRESYEVIVDVGCGFGRSFDMLNRRFRPARMIGIDVDAKMLANSSVEARRCGMVVELKRASASALPLASESVDMIFCHQTFHHVIDQHGALREFHRVLKPGGLLLFAESTRAYIHSWIIRLLFRHPMEVQRSAAEYLAMIRGAGFEISARSVSYPYLWWSRGDLGIGERWFGTAPAANHEETLINLVAIRD